jgi:drug/metabolite transporter (DMT)-like permease
MEAESLQGRLGNLEQGARWFQVLGVVLVVLGIVGVVGGGLKLLLLLQPGSQWAEVLVGAASTASDGVIYLVLGWFARRAGDAFTSIVAVIRELGEIV